MNMIEEEQQENYIDKMSRTGGKDAFARTASTQKMMPNIRSSSQNMFEGHMRTSYNNGIVVLDNQQPSKPRFSESLQAKLRQNQLQRQQQELEAKRLKEKELNRIACDDQKRKLKKVLELANQLNKKKDAAKIKEMLEQVGESQRPLPMSTINELRKLELMESPYSQPLIGMIKEIESQIQNRFGTGDATKRKKRKKRDQSENGSAAGRSAVGSSRRFNMTRNLASGVQSQGSVGSESTSSYHLMSQQPSQNKLGQRQNSQHFQDDTSPYAQEQQPAFTLTNQATALRVSQHLKKNSDPRQQETGNQKTGSESRRRNIVTGKESDAIRSPMQIAEISDFSDPVSRRISLTRDQLQQQNQSVSRKVNQNKASLPKVGNQAMKQSSPAAGNSDFQNGGNYQEIINGGYHHRSPSKMRNQVALTGLSHYSSINQVVEHEMEESVIEPSKLQSPAPVTQSKRQ